jgi:DNA-binding GntR family transcriptional regulator
MATKAKQSKKRGLSGIEKTEQAYKILKNRIFSGFYLPRQHLVESSLSEDLGVNRMNVREMLKRLALEGLVVTQPYKGCTVADISIQQAYETYQVEAILEGFAAFLAVHRIGNHEIKELENLIDESKGVDPREVERWEEYNRHIHGVINRGCRNGRLITMISDNVKFNNYWFIVLSTPGQIPKKNQEHEVILEAIKERNAIEVRQLVENHIMEAAEDIRERLQNMFPIFESGNRSISYE